MKDSKAKKPKVRFNHPAPQQFEEDKVRKKKKRLLQLWPRPWLKSKSLKKPYFR